MQSQVAWGVAQSEVTDRVIGGLISHQKVGRLEYRCHHRTLDIGPGRTRVHDVGVQGLESLFVFGHGLPLVSIPTGMASSLSSAARLVSYRRATIPAARVGD